MGSRILLLIFLLFIGHLSVAAAESRAVVFASGGETTAKWADFNGNDTAFKVGSGFKVTENSGIEIYWVAYGEATDSVDLGFGQTDIRAEAHSIAFQYLHYIPLAGSFDVFAKIGMAFWKTEYDVVGSSKVKDDGYDLIVGAGLDFEVVQDWALRAEWEYSEFDDIEVSLVSAGFAHYFD